MMDLYIYCSNNGFIEIILIGIIALTRWYLEACILFAAAPAAEAAPSATARTGSGEPVLLGYQVPTCILGSGIRLY